MSLKSRVGPKDLHRLISDVRRRVEHEFTYEGIERRIKYVPQHNLKLRSNIKTGFSFLSTIIPPTPETLALVLSEGGFPGYTSSQPSISPSPNRNPSADPAFAQLLAELRQIISSPAFGHVLEACFDRSTDVLFDDLRHGIFNADEMGSSIEEGKIRLANLLPELSRWAKLTLDTIPNTLVDVCSVSSSVNQSDTLLYNRMY